MYNRALAGKILKIWEISEMNYQQWRENIAAAQLLTAKKAVYKQKPGSVFNMVNAFIVYRDKSLVFIGATFREKLISYHPSGSE